MSGMQEDLPAIRTVKLKIDNMKKTIFSTKGQRADIGGIAIHRLLPNRYIDAVGPFVFLDHIPLADMTGVEDKGTGEHPHRGIATFTYLLHGEADHFDSIGNHTSVHSGGIQWMKAGNGIVHDESFEIDSMTGNTLTHAFQFWINLPSEIKEEKPEYLAIEGADVPKKELEDNIGWLKVLLGKYENLTSVIPDYSHQFMYHIHLESHKSFTLSVEKEQEIAAVLPTNGAEVNDAEYCCGEFIVFDKTEGRLVFRNNSVAETDILVFGGEHYSEPIVARGPFVMNSLAGIIGAYRDYVAGKYGAIVR
jgi:redox-sensitive bicupin YhaK (pirin superfamily)